MNIVQIRYFVAVYEMGSFSQAAKSQFITVQAVSKSIADLEQEIGQKLFDRKSHGAIATPFGRAFYGKALAALTSFDEAVAFVSRPNSPSDNELKLALCSPVFNNDQLVMKNIRTLLSKRLNSSIKLSITRGFEGLDLLRQSEVDALITIGKLNTPHTDCVEVLEAPTGVSMHAGHPLEANKCVTLEQLSAYPVCIAPDFDYFNESILVTYMRQGLTSRLVPITTKEDLLNFYQKDMGCGFTVALPMLESEEHKVSIRPICPEDEKKIPICLVTSKFVKTPLYLAAEDFLTGKNKG